MFRYTETHHGGTYDNAKNQSDCSIGGGCDMTYDIKIMGPLEYARHRLANYSLEELRELTDSGYPRWLALGYVSHARKEVVICKVLDWKLRLLHEIGHIVGLKHVMITGDFMHPWGIQRGWSSAGDKQLTEKARAMYRDVHDNSWRSPVYQHDEH